MGNNIVDASGYFADDGLADQVPFIFPDGGGLLVALTAYLDDLGAPITVAGYVFKARAYKRFVRDWRAKVLTLDGHAFPHFHMKDLHSGHEAYEGFTIADRVRILNAAVDVVCKHAFGAVGVHFNRAEFVAVAPPGWPNHMGSIYTATCQVCVQSTAHWLKERRCLDPVYYVLERGHKWQTEADAVLAAHGDSEQLRRTFLFRGHTFEHKERECGLQAADLHAWAITKMLSGDVDKPAFQPFREPIQRLGKKTKGRSHVGSFTNDLLRRFIEQQVTETRVAYANPGPAKRAFV